MLPAFPEHGNHKGRKKAVSRAHRVHRRYGLDAAVVKSASVIEKLSVHAHGGQDIGNALCRYAAQQLLDLAAGHVLTGKERKIQHRAERVQIFLRAELVLLRKIERHQRPQSEQLLQLVLGLRIAAGVDKIKARQILQLLLTQRQ